MEVMITSAEPIGIELKRFQQITFKRGCHIVGSTSQGLQQSTQLVL